MINILIVCIAAFLYTLGFPNFLFQGYFLFPIISLVLFGTFIKKQTHSLKMFFYFFLYMSVITFLGFYWLIYTFDQFAGIPTIASIGIMFIFSLISIAPYTVFFIGYLCLKNYQFKKKYQFALPIVLAFILCLIEYYLPQQFAVYLAHSWTHLKSILFLAPHFGFLIYSFLSYWIVFEIVIAHKKKSYLFPLISIITIIILGFFFPLTDHKSYDKHINIRLVQANIGNLLKLESESGGKNAYNEIIKRYTELSLIPSEQKIDLIIWPETAYPFDINSEHPNVPSSIQNIVNISKANFLFGGYGVINKNQNNKSYNSTFFIDDHFNISPSYNKHLLIPFGETLPFGPLNNKAQEIFSAVSLFDKGEEFRQYHLNDEFNFITPICYEILDTRFIADFLNNVKETHFMVNLTNDSWYGDSLEPTQHKILASWRALEFQIPLVRSTNTGITSILYPDGEESDFLKTNEKNILDHRLYLDSNHHPTLYQKYSILPFSFLILIILVISYFLRKKENS